MKREHFEYTILLSLRASGIFFDKYRKHAGYISLSSAKTVETIKLGNIWAISTVLLLCYYKVYHYQFGLTPTAITWYSRIPEQGHSNACHLGELQT